MKATWHASQIALIASPVLSRWSSLSMTQGPATKRSGAPPPSVNSPIRICLVIPTVFEIPGFEGQEVEPLNASYISPLLTQELR